jgi:excinuclease ABC subunit A
MFYLNRFNTGRSGQCPTCEGQGATGLHVADVTKLMQVLSRLVERGDTLVVIEHHPEVMAGADHLVELGPEGGARGGRVIASCPPRAATRLKTRTA